MHCTVGLRLQAARGAEHARGLGDARARSRELAVRFEYVIVMVEERSYASSQRPPATMCEASSLFGSSSLSYSEGQRCARNLFLSAVKLCSIIVNDANADALLFTCKRVASLFI